MWGKGTDCAEGILKLISCNVAFLCFRQWEDICMAWGLHSASIVSKYDALEHLPPLASICAAHISDRPALRMLPAF